MHESPKGFLPCGFAAFDPLLDEQGGHAVEVGWPEQPTSTRVRVRCASISPEDAITQL
jgi:hypothetical protein